MAGFRHIVCLTVQDGTTDEQIDAIVAELRELPSSIPEIRSYVVGRDAGLAEGNATIGVVADFDDEAGYVVYRDHAEHQRIIAESIRPVAAGRTAIQHVVS